MTRSSEDDDSLPLRELHRLAGGACAACGGPYNARELVGSVALGLKDAPRCLPCLARGLGRDPEELRGGLVAYVRRRECYARAWAEAERLDGPSPDWAPLDGTDASNEVDMPPATDATPDDSWDAGGMGCGELVLALRGRLNGMPPGAVLRVTATDPAAPEDLPAWCRLTGNPLVRMKHPEYHIRRKEG